MYRDGCGDGQMAGVAEFEVPQMVRAFEALNDSYRPKLTVLVVQKRGNSRFFLRENRDELANARMGTVIDQDVVKEEG